MDKTMKHNEYFVLHDAASAFFEVADLTNRAFSLRAAAEICAEAAARDLLIARIEGGNWRHPGFQPSGLFVWDGLDPPATADAAKINNDHGRRFVLQSTDCDAFILTSSPILGWWSQGHKPRLLR
jgi:Colicin-E5 Imm protein